MLEAPRLCKNHFFKPGARVSQTENSAEIPPYELKYNKFKLPKLAVEFQNLQERFKEIRRFPERKIMNIFRQGEHSYALKLMTSPNVQVHSQTPQSPIQQSTPSLRRKPPQMQTNIQINEVDFIPGDGSMRRFVNWDQRQSPHVKKFKSASVEPKKSEKPQKIQIDKLMEDFGPNKGYSILNAPHKSEVFERSPQWQGIDQVIENMSSLGQLRSHRIPRKSDRK